MTSKKLSKQERQRLGYEETQRRAAAAQGESFDPAKPAPIMAPQAARGPLPFGAHELLEHRPRRCAKCGRPTLVVTRVIIRGTVTTRSYNCPCGAFLNLASNTWLVSGAAALFGLAGLTVGAWVSTMGESGGDRGMGMLFLGGGALVMLIAAAVAVPPLLAMRKNPEV
jgi:hypothetical protein